MEDSNELPPISDQATQIFTWISLGVLCQIINIFGIATNIVNIVCFVKQGFEDSVNVSLLGLAISDLGSLITLLSTCVWLTPAVVMADLPFDSTDISYLTAAMPHFAFTRVSSWITVMITLERCLCITAPLKIKSIITPKRTAAVTVCVFIIFIFSGSPVFVVNRLGLRVSAFWNTTRIGIISTSNREQVEKFSFAINNFVIPFVAFIIIVVCTTILSFKLQMSTKWRQGTITSEQSERVSGRNLKVAKMVVIISCLFIVCFIPVNSLVLAMGLLPSLSINGKQINISMFIAGIGYIMESVNSSMNILIYYQMSSKYKVTLCKLCVMVEQCTNCLRIRRDSITQR